MELASRTRSILGISPFYFALLLGLTVLPVHSARAGAAGSVNPVPFVDILSPSRVAPGGQAFTLTVHGANFVSNSAVYWNTTALTTTYVSRGKLTASVPASLIASIGTDWITVVNPTPGGGKSNVLYLQVSGSEGTFNPSVFSYMGGTTAGNTAYFYGAAAGDLRSDGKLDLIGIDYNGYLWVFLSDGDGTFQAPVSYADTYGAYGAAVGDVDGDGKPDIVVAEADTTSAFSFHHGNGDGSFGSGTLFGPDAAVYTLQLADMNGDGKLDIIASDVSGNIYYAQGNGNGTFQNAVIIATAAQYPFTMAIGDFDGDGILDLIYSDTSGSNVYFLKGKGDGTFDTAVSYTAEAVVAYGAAADFNEDGFLDYFGGSTSTGNSSIFLNNTTGGFLAATAVNIGGDPQNIAVGDLNGDGHADVIGAGSTGLTVSYGEGNGSFQNTTSYNSSAFYGESVIVGNFVAGGGLGVAVTSYDTGGIDVLLPTVSISPSPLDFGSVAINSTTPAQGLTITNNTPIGITLTGTSITGTNSSDFAIASTTCGSTLAASASCTASVTFTPSASGALSANFNVADTAAGGTQTVQLTGTGAVAPAVNLSATSLNFSAVLVSSPSPAKVVTLKNTGDATLNISSIALSGTNAGDFGKNTTCGATVAIGATCTISVTLTPSATGARSASVIITDDALDSPESISLSGTGVTDVAQLSPGSLTFAGQMVTSTSSSQSITLSNIGGASLSITSIAVTGTNGGDFSESNNCGATLASQAFCTISVTFKPTAAGSRSATLTVTDSSPASPETASLSGTGQDFTFAVSAPQTISPGGTATFQLTVTPEDNFAQLITFTCQNSIAHSTCSVSPTSTTPSSANPVTVDLMITTTGPAAGAVPLTLPRGHLRLLALALPQIAVLALLVLFVAQRGKPARPHYVMLATLALALICVASGIAGCAGSTSSPYTPAGSYTVTVTATSGGLSHSVGAQVTVQ